ncbi:MAG: hypothetical protein ACTTJW_03615 [Sphaerochaeta sp.]
MRTEAEKRAQKRYSKKLYLFAVPINTKKFPEVVEFLQKLPNKTNWVIEKVKDLETKL